MTPEDRPPLWMIWVGSALALACLVAYFVLTDIAPMVPLLLAMVLLLGFGLLGFLRLLYLLARFCLRRWRARA